MVQFGDFQPLCRDTPSYTWCNLFYRQVCWITFLFVFFLPSTYLLHLQLSRLSNSTLQGASSDATSAPVGINPMCGIPRAGTNGSIGNVANIIACGLSIIVVVGLILRCNQRKAAVGKVFISTLLLIRIIRTPFVTPFSHKILQSFRSDADAFSPDRTHWTADIPRHLPYNPSSSTHHQWLITEAGHHCPRGTDGHSCRCRRRPLLVVAGQRHRCHPSSRRRNFREFSGMFFPRLNVLSELWLNGLRLPAAPIECGLFIYIPFYYF